MERCTFFVHILRKHKAVPTNLLMFCLPKHSHVFHEHNAPW